jgi:hypothetical protein
LAAAFDGGPIAKDPGFAGWVERKRNPPVANIGGFRFRSTLPMNLLSYSNVKQLAVIANQPVRAKRGRMTRHDARLHVLAARSARVMQA